MIGLIEGLSSKWLFAMSPSFNIIVVSDRIIHGWLFYLDIIRYENTMMKVLLFK